ncbi:MAG: hypothetical protein JNL58_05545 [Planctomyces sp.]|nr:hypothetical protein [Planctomyces sp.]
MAQSTDEASEKKSGDEEFSLIQEGTRPLATVTFASANRFVDEAKYIFEASGNPDSFKLVEELLDSRLNGLKGFNRDKPFGIMVYLPVAIPPLPEFIAFVPVDSVEDAQKLIEQAPVVIRKDTTEEGRYEIIGPNRTIPMMMRGGYAFIPLGDNPSPTILDRELPEPDQLVASQARQFDVSMTLDIASIPAGTRVLLTNLITAGVSSQLQQRDDEPEGAYKMRRAEGDRSVAALKQLLEECDRITMGVDVVQDEQAVNFDMVVDAVAGTKLFDEIFDSTTKPSYFIPLLNDDAPVSFSMSSTVNERDKNAFIEILDGMKMEIVRQIEINDLGPVPDKEGAIGQALTSLQKTLDEGHMDVFAQFYSDKSDKLAIVGAMRLQEGEGMAAGLQDLFGRLQHAADIEKAGELTVGYGEHLGITFHRFTLKVQPPPATEVFGSDIGITVGSSPTAMWWTIGGADSFDQLKAVMTQLDEALKNPQERQTPANFRIIVNMNKLIDMQQRVSKSIESSAGLRAEGGEAAATDQSADSTEPKPAPAEVAQSEGGGRGRGGRNGEAARRRARAGQIFRDTMAEGDDRIEVDFRPTETGGRTRIRLEEGFVKILGRLIAAQFSTPE